MPRRDRSRESVRLANLDAQKQVLPNGLSVVICPRPALAWTYAALYFGVGSRHESATDNGLTHVLEHMLFRGTRSFTDSTALNAAAEDFGGYLDGATFRDHLMFATGCHPTAVEDAIAILGEIAQAPRYRDMRVEKEILREELLETLDHQGQMVDLDNVAHASIFGARGLGLPIEGTLANLERFGRADLEAHRRRFLTARNAVISIAGPVDPARVLRAARRAFGSMSQGEAAVAPDDVAAPSRGATVHCVYNSSSQVDLRLSFWAVPVGDPDYAALVLLARLLADGLASRLHAELVDRQGLAYSLNAGLTTYHECGLFEFEVSVAPDRVARVAGQLLQFATAAKRMRFSEAELQRTLRRYRYGLEFMADDAADLASWHGRAVLFDIEREAADLYRRFSKLGLADLHHAASRFFAPQRLNVAAVGELSRREMQRLRRVVADWR